MQFAVSNAPLRLLMHDEAFARMDQRNADLVIRFAQQLGMGLVIASPNLDLFAEGVNYATAYRLRQLPTARSPARRCTCAPRPPPTWMTPRTRLPRHDGKAWARRRPLPQPLPYKGGEPETCPSPRWSPSPSPRRGGWPKAGRGSRREPHPRPLSCEERGARCFPPRAALVAWFLPS